MDLTPERSRRRARGWLLTAVITWVIYVPMRLADLPLHELLQNFMILALVFAATRYGWAKGYEAKVSAEDPKQPRTIRSDQ